MSPSEQIPPTYLARVAKWDAEQPERLTFWLWGQSPNFFHGSPQQLDQLMRDFGCIEGMGWVPWSDRGHGKLGVPYEIRESTVREPTQQEAVAILADLFGDVCSVAMALRHLPGATMSAVVDHTDEQIDWLVSIAAGTVGEYAFAPNDLPDDTKAEPAYTWAFRVVELVLAPGAVIDDADAEHSRGAYPDQWLVEWKERWWRTWA